MTCFTVVPSLKYEVRRYFISLGNLQKGNNIVVIFLRSALLFWQGSDFDSDNINSENESGHYCWSSVAFQNLFENFKTARFSNKLFEISATANILDLRHEFSFCKNHYLDKIFNYTKLSREVLCLFSDLLI